MADTNHKVTISLMPGEGIEVRLECLAPPGSNCNEWCREGCEIRDEEHESHEMHPVDCMLAEWWGYDTAASEEGYNGERRVLHEGVLHVDGWGEDGVDWSLAP